jgi:hypothetical protein
MSQALGKEVTPISIHDPEAIEELKKIVMIS